MTTQLLFGESMRILDTSSNWLYIQSTFEDYLGWVDKNQVEIMTEAEFDRLNHEKSFICQFPFGKITTPEDKSGFLIPAGSVLPGLSEEGKMLLLSRNFEFQGEYTDGKAKSHEDIINTAKQFLGSPYLWGGKTLMGMDCSGFTQVVFKINGIALLRDASQQATQGLNVGFISEANPGDLAFFDNAEGRISHVGIVLEDHKIIHCSGKVRIDTIDHQGIFREESRTYSHALRLIRNIIQD
jgi:cell wall-associated NlpC family hydrolase